MSSKTAQLLRRFLAPGFVVSIVYFLKHRAKISPRAEVELSSKLRFGRGSVVGSFTKIKASRGEVAFGERCAVGTGCFISAGERGIRFGDHVLCGPNVAITSNSYVYDRVGVPLEDQGHTSKGIVIGDRVWLGAGSVVLDGAELGDDCIVVANSLVSRRYPARSIIQGNPAEVIFERRAD